jgi:hypothetical protein
VTMPAVEGSGRRAIEEGTSNADAMDVDEGPSVAEKPSVVVSLGGRLKKRRRSDSPLAADSSGPSRSPSPRQSFEVKKRSVKQSKRLAKQPKRSEAPRSPSPVTPRSTPRGSPLPSDDEDAQVPPSPLTSEAGGENNGGDEEDGRGGSRSTTSDSTNGGLVFSPRKTRSAAAAAAAEALESQMAESEAEDGQSDGISQPSRGEDDVLDLFLSDEAREALDGEAALEGESEVGEEEREQREVEEEEEQGEDELDEAEDEDDEEDVRAVVKVKKGQRVKKTAKIVNSQLRIKRKDQVAEYVGVVQKLVGKVGKVSYTSIY